MNQLMNVFRGAIQSQLPRPNYLSNMPVSGTVQGGGSFPHAPKPMVWQDIIANAGGPASLEKPKAAYGMKMKRKRYTKGGRF